MLLHTHKKACSSIDCEEDSHMEDLEEDEPTTLVPIPGRKLSRPPHHEDESSNSIGFPDYTTLYQPYMPGGNGSPGASKGGRSYTKKDMEDALDALRQRKLSLTR